MKTIAFYSYKGGVGRTLALVRTATQIALMGKKVLAVDLDLEAPGLHSKLGGLEPGPGFVEYFYHPLYGDRLLRVRDLVQRSTLHENILLLPAGASHTRDYWRALNRMDWHSLMHDDETGIAMSMRLKAEIEADIQPDFLLVDSRTGITEMAGIALSHWADVAVCFFANNEESVWGTAQIMSGILRTPRPLEGMMPVRVVSVLTRYPRPASREEARRELALLEDLRRRFARDGRDGGAGQELNVGPILVIHSTRDLERDERSYLDRTAESQRYEGIEYDFLRLFEALDVERMAGPRMGELRRAVWRGLLEEARTNDTRPDHDAAAIRREEAIGVVRKLDAPEDLGTTLLEHAQQLLERGLSDPQDALQARSEELVGEALEALWEIENHDPDGARRTEAAWRSVEALLGLRQFTEAREALGRAFALSARQRSELWLQHWKRVRPKLDQSRTVVFDDILISASRAVRATGRPAEARALLDALLDPGPISETQALDAKVRRELGRWMIDDAEWAGAVAMLERAREDFRLVGAERELMDELESELRSARDGQRRSAGGARPGMIEAPAPESSRGDARQKTPGAPATRGGSIPLPSELPARRERTARSSELSISIQIPLRIVTPVLGGGVVPRALDEVDVLRVPTIRGHLRFWWRALHACGLPPAELFQREARWWGRAADDTGGRSVVEVWITDLLRGQSDTSDVDYRTAGAYALWPARATRSIDPLQTAPRRRPGTRFTLHLRCPAALETEVRATLRAWILFGGYGGRTRRGLGSLTVSEPAELRRWLPIAPTREAITACFDEDVLAPLPAGAAHDTPLLQGAGLHVESRGLDAEQAWTTALGWLQEFRQGQSPTGQMGMHSPRHARDRGDGRRPGRSNWPEPDKVRQLSGRGPWAHMPHHNERPVWPRAALGLPIISQWQRNTRQGSRYGNREPEPYELRWEDHDPTVPRDERDRDRLASPLIVKAMPLADGRFVPCALWLFRGYPKSGKVTLHPRDPRAERSKADFDELVASGDKALFEPLAVGQNSRPGVRLRTAFFYWLEKTFHTQVVA